MGKGISSPLELRDQSATPANPPSGSLLLYSVGGKVYSRTSTGTVTELGAGGGGGSPTAYTPTNPPPGAARGTLKAWRAAYADRLNNRAVIAGIGDSIMEGVGAGDTRYSWMHRMALMTTSGSEAPPYFLPIRHPLTTSPWTDSGSNSDQPAFGIGRRSRNFPAAAYAETTFTGDRFTVHYAKDTGAGTVTVTVDGTQIGTFSAANPTYLDGAVWDSGQLSYGRHVVRITSGGTFRFGGVKFFGGDFANGVHVYPGGTSGATSEGWRKPVGLNDADDNMWPAAYAAIQPDLVIINLIANDYLAQSDPALTGANYSWLVATLRRVCAYDPSFLFVIPPQRSDVTPTTGKNYDDYVNAILAAAAGDSEIEVLDLRQGMSPTAVSSDPTGLWYDNIHPSSTGHQRIADMLIEHLGMDSAVIASPSRVSLVLPEAADSAVANPPVGAAALYTVDGSSLRLRDEAGFVRTVGSEVADINLQSDYVNTTPSGPLFGLRAFSRHRARRMLSIIGPTGQDTQLQPAMFSNRIARWSAVNGTTTPSIDGIAVTAVGTAAAVSVASTNFYTGRVRQRFSSSATAATAAGLRTNTAQWFLSSTANEGGLFFVARLGLGVISGSNRLFVGMSATTAALAANVNPSTYLNMFGFASDGAQTNWQFMCNDGTGTATQVDLGTSFPSQVAATNFFEFRIFAPSGGGQQVFWSAHRLNDGVVVQGQATADLPALGTLLAAHINHSNGAAAAAVSIDLQSLYIETDN